MSTEVRSGAEGETSLFDLAALVVRNRRWLILAGAAGVVLALLPLAWTARKYSATASFTPQAADMQRAGLNALAGQFGLNIPVANSSQSPQFYADLVKSTGILAEFVRDSFEVTELGPGQRPFVTLFRIKGSSPQELADRTVKVLSRAVSTRISAPTGVVTVVVTTPWRSVSLAIGQRLLDRVNQFDLENRQTHASNERRFVERRLADARAQLTDAENRLEHFLSGNRQLGSSPLLTLQRERHERDVAIRQQVVTTLVQSYEEVRIREVRDTPVISVIQRPTAPARPASRGLPLRVVAGGMFGAFVALVLILAAEGIARRRRAGDQHVIALLDQVRGMRPAWLGRKTG